MLPEANVITKALIAAVYLQHKKKRRKKFTSLLELSWVRGRNENATYFAVECKYPSLHRNLILLPLSLLRCSFADMIV